MQVFYSICDLLEEKGGLGFHNGTVNFNQFKKITILSEFQNQNQLKKWRKILGFTSMSMAI
jgi:hypothetical protein